MILDCEFYRYLTALVTSRWPHLEGEGVKVRVSITKVSAGENRLIEGRLFRIVKSKREESFDPLKPSWAHLSIIYSWGILSKGCPQKRHFLNCRFAKPGLRVCSQLAVEGRFFGTPSLLKTTYVSLLPFLWLCYSHLIEYFFLDTSWQYGSEGEKEAELLGLFRFRSCLLNYLLMECVDQEVCNYYIFILYICRTLVEAISDYIVLHVLYI